MESTAHWRSSCATGNHGVLSADETEYVMAGRFWRVVSSTASS